MTRWDEKLLNGPTSYKKPDDSHETSEQKYGGNKLLGIIIIIATRGTRALRAYHERFNPVALPGYVDLVKALFNLHSACYSRPLPKPNF